MKNKTDFELIKVLWDYMHMNHTLEKADAILVLGCSDMSVVDVGVDVYKKGYADKIIFSGGLGKDTSKMWDEPEANKFAKKAQEQGIPANKIIIENKFEIIKSIKNAKAFKISYINDEFIKEELFENNIYTL